MAGAPPCVAASAGGSGLWGPDFGEGARSAGTSHDEGWCAVQHEKNGPPTSPFPQDPGDPHPAPPTRPFPVDPQAPRPTPRPGPAPAPKPEPPPVAD